jgi:hypothetical protein
VIGCNEVDNPIFKLCPARLHCGMLCKFFLRNFIWGLCLVVRHPGDISWWYAHFDSSLFPVHFYPRKVLGSVFMNSKKSVPMLEFMNLNEFEPFK